MPQKKNAQAKAVATKPGSAKTRVAAPAKAAAGVKSGPASKAANNSTLKPAAKAAPDAKPDAKKAQAAARAAKSGGKAPAASKPAAKPSRAEPRAAAFKTEAAPPRAGAAAARHSASRTAPARAVPASVAKPASQKVTAAVAPAASKDGEAARAAIAAQKKPVSQRHGFKTNEFVVYPAHGVGRIVGIEEQEIAGMSLELFVITFEKEKLTLRVPTGKSQSVGMRKLAEGDVVKRAMDLLKGRARVKRTMWSRRAQEYVAKINSGDLVSIAEVVRDLYRSEAQPEQSYSERQLYEDALDRMAREIAAIEKLDERGALQRITEILAKSARGRRLAAEEAEAAEREIKAA